MDMNQMNTGILKDLYNYKLSDHINKRTLNLKYIIFSCCNALQTDVKPQIGWLN